MASPEKRKFEHMSGDAFQTPSKRRNRTPSDLQRTPASINSGLSIHTKLTSWSANGNEAREFGGMLPGLNPIPDTVERVLASDLDEYEVSITFIQEMDPDVLKMPLHVKLKNLNSVDKVHQLVYCLFGNSAAGGSVQYGLCLKYSDLETERVHIILPAEMGKCFGSAFNSAIVHLADRQVQSIQLHIMIPSTASYRLDKIVATSIFGEQKYKSIKSRLREKYPDRQVQPDRYRRREQRLNNVTRKPVSKHADTVKMEVDEDCTTLDDIPDVQDDHDKEEQRLKLRESLAQAKANEQPAQLRSPTYSSASNRSTPARGSSESQNNSRNTSPGGETLPRPRYMPREIIRATPRSSKKKQEPQSDFFREFIPKLKKQQQDRIRREKIEAAFQNRQNNGKTKDSPRGKSTESSSDIDKQMS